jgi:hypothetical protein
MNNVIIRGVNFSKSLKISGYCLYELLIDSIYSSLKVVLLMIEL